MLSKLSDPLPSNHRKGGWRQQMLWARQSSHAKTTRKSSKGEASLYDWAEGSISSVRLRKHMDASFLDGDRHPLIMRLGKVGGASPDSGQCHADLIKLLQSCGFDDFVTESASDPRHQYILPSTVLKLMRSRSQSGFGAAVLMRNKP